ncbi:hypothetical protein PG984_007026 [Apiospora sp. TS-2023a]
MPFLPRWNVLLCGIVLLLGAVALIHPFLRLESVGPYVVASPWSPDSPDLKKDEPPPSPPPAAAAAAPSQEQPPLPPPVQAEPPATGPTLKYKPAPTYTAPPVKDPFPLLSATSTPPPIPAYNIPKPDAWKAYDGVSVAPPLLIGFTRNWPMLLQTVVSYLTAGWPADQLYVIENTGTHQANARGQLSLQNPRFLNHTQLKDMLGVRVIQTPVLLSFAQLQNFFLALSYEHGWPYYFWSHMDVLALSHEAGVPGLTAPAGEPGYKSLYTLCLETLQQTLRGDTNTDDTTATIANPEKKEEGSLPKFWRTASPPPPKPAPRWAARLFAYDHLTLQNPRALEAIGGWDTFIPYYMTDCDAYSRFAMDGWSMEDADAGIITDTASVLDDLRALYRDPGVTPSFSDPNPPPPTPEDKAKARSEEKKTDVNDDDAKKDRRKSRIRRHDGSNDPENNTPQPDSTTTTSYEKGPSNPLPLSKRDVPFPHEPMNLTLPTDYWWLLRREADNMFHHKHGGTRGRNTWQWAQRGGDGEPFHYDAGGFEESIGVLTEAGKQVFARKWGHRDCDLKGYKMGDQWRVEKDW